MCSSSTEALDVEGWDGVHGRTRSLRGLLLVVVMLLLVVLLFKDLKHI